MREHPEARVPLATIAREWFRIGVTGFGGPPTHITMLRALCVRDRAWLSEREFEDGIAATNLTPGPASSQLAIYCAWRLRGTIGALLGGLCFILPGLVIILGLSVVFLGADPPSWVSGAAAGAGAVVAAVAIQAARDLVPGSWKRTLGRKGRQRRWLAYLVVGGVSGITFGPYLVIVLLTCGLIEVVAETRSGGPPHARAIGALAAPAVVGGLGALAWVAFKVGALSYGGGFVIIPLMQHDAVSTYHWMTSGQFLDAVALGQVTPGPIVLTVAAVGYAAAGIGGGVLAAAVAFAPSFAIVIAGGRHLDRLRDNERAQAFLTGVGPAAIGAIGGASVPLALALSEAWQVVVLVLAFVWVVVLRRSVVAVFGGAAAVGVIAALAGAPTGH